MNQLKKQKSKVPFVVVALLGTLLGAQVAVSAFVDPVSTPNPTQYGFNSGADSYVLFGSDTTAASAYIVGRCTGHYSAAGSVAACETGGTAGYNAKKGKGGGGTDV